MRGRVRSLTLWVLLGLAVMWAGIIAGAVWAVERLSEWLEWLAVMVERGML